MDVSQTTHAVNSGFVFFVVMSLFIGWLFYVRCGWSRRMLSLYAGAATTLLITIWIMVPSAKERDRQFTQMFYSDAKTIKSIRIEPIKEYSIGQRLIDSGYEFRDPKTINEICRSLEFIWPYQWQTRPTVGNRPWSCRMIISTNDEEFTVEVMSTDLPDAGVVLEVYYGAYHRDYRCDELGTTLEKLVAEAKAARTPE